MHTAIEWLYLIEILHQTTTIAVVRIPVLRCILLKFYIKPQLTFKPFNSAKVVSY